MQKNMRKRKVVESSMSFRVWQIELPKNSKTNEIDIKSQHRTKFYAFKRLFFHLDKRLFERMKDFATL